MWTAVKIIAAVSATLLSLMFIGLLVMVTRPAVIVGVSESALGRSVSNNENGTPCSRNDDGNWVCPRETNRGMAHYRVDVDWMGCWEADRSSGPETEFTPATKSGCVELGDVVTFD